MGAPGGWRWRNVPVPEAHVGLLLAGLALHRRRRRHIPYGPAPRPVGWMLTAAGLALVVQATRSAGRIELAEPDRLVTSGPYAVSRHPMYAGWTLIYAGVTLSVDSAWLVAGLPLLMALTRREARREEARLEAIFGTEYRAYRTRVRRWL